jgi:hypothetical protein
MRIAIRGRRLQPDGSMAGALEDRARPAVAERSFTAFRVPLTQRRTAVRSIVMTFLRCLAALLVVLPALAAAEEPAHERTEADVIRSCLATWPDNPFQGDELPHYKVIGGSVSVLGIGGEVVDEEKTSEPRLVLVKPSVNVLTKGQFRLMNPNGWYCFESAVTVLAKSEITAACGAHIASSIDGLVVGGENKGAEGVTVFGKAVVKRVGCEPGEH